MATEGLLCSRNWTWLHAHPGWVMTIYQVGKLFENVYMRAETAENAASSLRKAGHLFLY
jgi:hypothetical protein